MSEEDRLRSVEGMIEKFDEYRAQRMQEKPSASPSMWRQELQMDEETYLVMMSRNNLWAILDVRDAAQAIEKGLSASFEGSHPLFVNDRFNSAGIASETLISLFFPQVKTRKRPLMGNEALVSIERARQLIGFEPEYSFSDRKT
jgi:nucleoside-diphosphate-sugar epimerase